MINELKTCTQCKNSLSIKEFHKDKTHKDGLKSRCKKCRKKENPERARQYTRDYYKKNSKEIKKKNKIRYRQDPRIKEYRLAHNRARRKALGENYAYTFLESYILQIYGTKCHICKKEIDLLAARRPGDPGWEFGLHIDHVTPVSKGGSGKIENLRPSHGVCNLRKGDKVN